MRRAHMHFGYYQMSRPDVIDSDNLTELDLISMDPVEILAEASLAQLPDLQDDPMVLLYHP
ncbi:hypothetical protein [Austwickia chelonae]|uniref:hypothetical protein n=1 Tax=Austwickia chelonae TaxID=100225 RepID=UPI0013C37260|nr:hypothetical protein [Austwickia chelonae]